MRRRELLGVLGSAATWPVTAQAQQTDQPPRVGFVASNAESNPEEPLLVAAFRAFRIRRQK